MYQNSSLIPLTFKQDILNNIVLPSFKYDIKQLEKERIFWEGASSICNFLVSIFLCVTIIASALKYSELTTISAVLSISFKEFISISNSQVHIKTIKYNELLIKLNLPPIFQDDTNTVDTNTFNDNRNV